MVTPRSQQDEAAGFTLIELLVVVVIIGILAAVAIPVFLSQRAKGYDSEAKSDLRNLANFEEIYLNDRGTYGTIAQIQSVEPRDSISVGVTVSVLIYDTDRGYCLSASHPGAATWFYDSQSGGLQPAGTTACPVTSTGLPGDSVTG